MMCRVESANGGNTWRSLNVCDVVLVIHIRVFHSRAIREQKDQFGKRSLI